MQTKTTNTALNNIEAAKSMIPESGRLVFETMIKASIQTAIDGTEADKNMTAQLMSSPEKMIKFYNQLIKNFQKEVA